MKTKYYLFLIVLLFSSKLSFSQSKNLDSIPNDNYSNLKLVDVSTVYNDFSKVKSNTIVIINNKIFRIDDKEFKDLNKSQIQKMEIIKDEKSKSGIKYILMITTK